jgi:transketolase
MIKTIYNGEKDSRLYKQVVGPTVDKLMEEDKAVLYLDADLMNCSGTGKLPEKYDRAIDVGIAEANMIGIACGASAVGMKPIVHSFGPFASRRSFDQLFLSGGYSKNSVTVIGTDPGITAAFNGGTHMPFEDVALYRVIPGAIVVDCTDITMFTSFLRIAKDTQGVKYVRIPRKESYPVYPEGTEFTFGKGFVLREGKDATVVASGIMVHEAMEAAKKLSAEGIEISVIDPYTIKPLDKDLILEYAKKTGVIVTAENHNKIGGLYSAVKDALDGEAKTGYVAIEDEFGEVGPQDYLRTRFDLTDDHIVRVVKETMKRAGK